MVHSVQTFRTPKPAVRSAFELLSRTTLFNGDCEKLLKLLPDDSIDLIVSSPPYCMGKEYETSNDLKTFRESHNRIFPNLVRALKPGGSICWQVGVHVKDGMITPLDYLVYAEMTAHESMRLRNRIVWSFGHGLHCTNRFSGRHETVLWFTKGDEYSFDLDAVRVDQKYPGKLHSKGPNKGKPSGNPLGKNPGDVWEIPNVKAQHIEKTEHPCQFPVGLVHRLIRALCPEDGLVFDPFSGSGSAGVAAAALARRYLGAELVPEYVEISKDRIAKTSAGLKNFRLAEKEIYTPKETDPLLQNPWRAEKINSLSDATLS